MSRIKFNHVFTLLLAGAAASAFLIPEKYTSRPLPGVQAVFAPVSLPVRRVGAWAHDRVVVPDAKDKRSVAAVRDENVVLSTRIDYLEKQLEVERKRNAEWEQIGDLRNRCVAVAVAGTDSGPRDSLALPGSTVKRVRDGDYALYPGGVAGQVQGRTGIGGAQVRLVTDRGFKVLGHFVRPGPKGERQPTTRTSVLFEGVGEGAMVVRAAVTWDEVEKGQKVRVGDVAVLADRDWPLELHGQRLGVVTKVERMRQARQFAEIRVEPSRNLEMLREVMVFRK
jgi:hypothetical protein